MSTLQTTQIQNPSRETPAIVLNTDGSLEFTGGLQVSNAITFDTDPTNTYKATFGASSSLTQNVSLTLPTTNGSAGQALVTNGSGVTSWATVAPDLTVARTLTGAQTFNCPIVFNDNAADVDLRLEGTTSPNLVFLDASANRIGINQASPAATIDVSGNYTSAPVAIGSGTNINCSLGNYFTINIAANTTLTVSNVPQNRLYTFVLSIYHTGGTITWFTSNWPNATAPVLYTPKYHQFVFYTDNGGTTWRTSYLTNFDS